MVDVLAQLGAHRIVPVVVIDDVAHAPALADGLKHGGLPVAEVTFRTPAAAAAIKEMSADPEMLVGAGTVLTPRQVDDAIAAGARFIVSPGISRAVIRHCRQLGIPVIPGTVTASEIMTALDEGLDLVKFFPAETSGGIPALKALSAPFPQCRFVPTGGIGPGTAAAYLRLPFVAAIGGSWMVPAAAVRTRDTSQITELTREAVGLASATAPTAITAR